MEAVDLHPVTKETQAEAIVNLASTWSIAGGMLPIPLVDLAAIGGIQIKMLDDLAKLYDVPFSRNAAKSIIGALIGTGGSVALGMPVASLMKSIPVIGSIAALLTEPAIAYGATYALGKVFILHFESGGTFLDFDADKMRAYYATQADAARAGAPKPATVAAKA